MGEFDLYARSREQFHSISAQRHLEGAVRLTRLIGILFVGMGGCLMLLFWSFESRPPILTLALTAALVVAPGIVFVVAGIFLKQRRYGAWKILFTMTILVFLAVIFLSLAMIIDLLRINAADTVWLPGIVLICMGAALSSVLFSLRRCLPALLEGDQVGPQGFAVIPVAQSAESPPTESTSPYSSPPAP